MPTILTAVLRMLKLSGEIVAAYGDLIGEENPEIKIEDIPGLLASVHLLGGEPVPFRIPALGGFNVGAGILANIANISQWGWNTQNVMGAISEVVNNRGVYVGAGELWDVLPARIRAQPALINIQDTVQIFRNLRITGTDYFALSHYEMPYLPPITETAEVLAKLTATDILDIDYRPGQSALLGELRIQYGENEPAHYAGLPRIFKPGLTGTDLFDSRFTEHSDQRIIHEAFIKARLNTSESAVVSYPETKNIILADTAVLGTGLKAAESSVVTYSGKHRIQISEAAAFKLPFITGADMYMPPFEYTFVYDIAGTSDTTATVRALPGKDVTALCSTRGPVMFSAGWEVVASVNDFSTSMQSLWVLKRTADSTTESLTVTVEAGGSVLAIQLISFSENIELDELWNFHGGVSDNNTRPLRVPDKMPGDMILWALSTNLWIGTEGSWTTNPNDLELLPGGSDPRHAAFFDEGRGMAVNRTFNIVGNFHTGWGALMLKITPSAAAGMALPDRRHELKERILC